MPKESVYFRLGAIGGSHDAKELKSELDAFPGVLSVSVNAEKNTLAVDFDDTGVKRNQLKDLLEDLGYRVESLKSEPHVM